MDWGLHSQAELELSWLDDEKTLVRFRGLVFVDSPDDGTNSTRHTHCARCAGCGTHSDASAQGQGGS